VLTFVYCHARHSADGGRIVLTPQERRAIAKNFLGFGEPEAPIWFVGLEEAGEWTQNDDERYATGHFPFSVDEIARDARSHGRSYTKVYEIMSKLVVAAIGDPTLRDWRAYRDNCLMQRGSHAFQANLFPLGKSHLSTWPEDYASGFGFPSRRDYYDWARGDRFDLLRSKHSEYAPRVTVCFGKSGWDDFIRVFDLSEECDDSIAGCRVYPSSRVVLTPFFDRRLLNSQKIGELGELLHRLYTRGLL
jgi:hypothetical protein